MDLENALLVISMKLNFTTAMITLFFAKENKMIMKLKTLGLIVFLLTAGACDTINQEMQFQEYIKSNLNDPESAKFRNFSINKDNLYACIVWNAKNAMGGYGKWNYTAFTKQQSMWIIENENIEPENCTQNYLDNYDEAITLINSLLKTTDKELEELRTIYDFDLKIWEASPDSLKKVSESLKKLQYTDNQ